MNAARRLAGTALATIALLSVAAARPAVSCGGAALLGGAQLLCSQVDPKAPAQLCTFRWALATPANQTQVVSGSFLLPPGASGGQWWDPGVAGRRKRHLEIAPWVYQLTSSAIALPAEEERMYVVAFLPVGKAEAANEVATATPLADSTLVLKR